MAFSTVHILAPHLCGFFPILSLPRPPITLLPTVTSTVIPAPLWCSSLGLAGSPSGHLANTQGVLRNRLHLQFPGALRGTLGWTELGEHPPPGRIRTASQCRGLEGTNAEEPRGPAWGVKLHDQPSAPDSPAVGRGAREILQGMEPSSLGWWTGVSYIASSCMEESCRHC